MARVSDSALIIDWSPRFVRVLDPVTGQIQSGESLAQCVGASGQKRSAIVGVNSRCAFVQSLPLPALSRTETERIAALQLGALFPIPAGESAFGIRMGAQVIDGVRPIAVGAMKAANFSKLRTEATELGLALEAIVPLAFGSWAAARERGLANAIVVTTGLETTALDIIRDGELSYSRSIPSPVGSDDLEAEIQRTFHIANLPAAPVLWLGASRNPDEAPGPDPLVALSRLKGQHSQLIVFNLPESAEQLRSKDARTRSVRALAACAVAAAAVTVAYFQNAPKPADPQAARRAAALRTERAKETQARSELAQIERELQVLEAALRPGQTPSDVVVALSNAATAKSWLTNITIARGAPVSMSGLAMDEEEVARISANVAKDPRFEDMKVVSQTKTTIGEKTLSQFLVLGRIRGLLPFDRPFRRVEKSKEKPKA